MKIYEIAFSFWLIQETILQPSSTSFRTAHGICVYNSSMTKNGNLMLSFFEFSNKECGFTSKLWEEVIYTVVLFFPPSFTNPLSFGFAFNHFVNIGNYSLDSTHIRLGYPPSPQKARWIVIAPTPLLLQCCTWYWTLKFRMYDPSKSARLLMTLFSF